MEIKKFNTGTVNNTEGIEVEKVDIDQGINDNFNNNQNVEDVSIENTRADFKSTVHTKFNVNEDQVETVSTEQTINEFSNFDNTDSTNDNFGLNNSQSSTDTQLSGTITGMDSSSVRDIHVSGDTNHVGSYSEDAKNNGVFGINPNGDTEMIKEDSGLNHSQTSTDAQLSGTIAGMDSSSVQDIYVNGDTNHVGSYIDDAKNSGVFRMNPQDSVEKEFDHSHLPLNITGINSYARNESSSSGGGTIVELDPALLYSEIERIKSSVLEKFNTIDTQIQKVVNINQDVRNNSTNRQLDAVNNVIPKIASHYKIDSTTGMSWELFGAIMLGFTEIGLAGIGRIPNLPKKIQLTNYGMQGAMIYINNQPNVFEIINSIIIAVGMEVTQYALAKEVEGTAIEIAATMLDGTIVGAPVGIAGNILGIQVIIEGVNRAIVGAALCGLLSAGILPAIESFAIDGKLQNLSSEIGNELLNNNTGEALGNDPIADAIEKQIDAIKSNAAIYSTNMTEILNLCNSIVDEFGSMDIMLSSDISQNKTLSNLQGNIKAPKIEKIVDKGILVDKTISTIKENQEKAVYDKLQNSNNLNEVAEYSRQYQMYVNMMIADACKTAIGIYVGIQDGIKWLHESFTNIMNTAKQALKGITDNVFAKMTGLSTSVEFVVYLIDKLEWLIYQAVKFLMSASAFPDSGASVVNAYNNLKEESIPWEMYIESIKNYMQQSVNKNVYGDTIEEIKLGNSSILESVEGIKNDISNLVIGMKSVSKGKTFDELLSVIRVVEEEFKKLEDTIKPLMS